MEMAARDLIQYGNPDPSPQSPAVVMGTRDFGKREAQPTRHALQPLYNSDQRKVQFA